ncbi:helix-turn-helix domain-containing protein [Sodalis praecaptivus]|uniref:helix-turn-helix domain-containing protein n=1 Tax=Sodalis TaxID=84565 RepID=UPI00046D4D85|nr:helix-turn-helix transcriptional regulator [Sodalis praecaptivus]
MSSIYTEDYLRVIRLLRQARIDSGISQQQLADVLKRPPSFIAKIEHGERRLDFVELIQLARLLNIDPISLIERVQQDLQPIIG